jgi:hypothetical protein
MKWRGRYFLFTSGCTGWRPNAARLAVASSIWGPWQHVGNPVEGTEAQKANTFESQSTYVLAVPGKPDAFIFMADCWRPQDARDGRYLWLPVEFEHDLPVLRWRDHWSLNEFEQAAPDRKP